tara:strand:+ start:289 stop:453 length:165 start_codon:yes stop_codon:yes gene_type:complete
MEKDTKSFTKLILAESRNHMMMDYVNQLNERIADLEKIIEKLKREVLILKKDKK